MRFGKGFAVWMLLLAAVGGAVSLSGCDMSVPTPTAAVPTLTEAAAGPPTEQAPPTATLAPTLTPSPAPPTRTPTPSATATPSATPTVTPTPSPTPPPSAQLEAARRQQVNGEYEEAIAAYEHLITGTEASREAHLALFHQAECYLQKGDSAASATAWERFIAAYPQDERLPAAHFMAARAYQVLGDCQQAVPHLEAYVALESTLGDLAYQWIGDCQAAKGEPDEALIAYGRALELAADASTQVGLREKIASLYLAQARFDDALAQYDAILAVARIGSYRAKIEYLAGQALEAADRSEAAYARYRRAMDQYPEAEHAYLSLVALLDAEVPVDEFERGLIDAYAGKAYPAAYDAAVRAFDRYLAATPAPKADEALYRKGLVLREMGRLGEALAAFEQVILRFPKSQWLASAWFEKAATLAKAGDTNRAVKTYQDMAAFFPADKLAPQALWNAARLCEGEGDYPKAAKLYEGLQADFPGYENADQALWRAGLAHYRVGSQSHAVADWRALADKYPSSAHRPAALYWLGKVAGEDRKPRQNGDWDEVARLYPHNYYGLRVQQHRSQAGAPMERMVLGPVEPPSWQPQRAEAEVLGWLRGWTQVPTGTQLTELSPVLAARADIRRGQALLAVGLRKEALASFDAARAAVWNSPLSLAQLAFYLHDQGVYGLAARCAARLAGLWPGGVIQEAPTPVRWLAYPLAYADLISAEAERQRLDPLLLAALVRQESLFEPSAGSSAGALGLGQVMPATGEGIARSLGMVGFRIDDLFRPSVSIRFGAYYLGVQLKRFDGEILVALAAYNGGPGRALSWLEASGGDMDWFVEVIHITESRTYVQRVYEHYHTYEDLYR